MVGLLLQGQPQKKIDGHSHEIVKVDPKPVFQQPKRNLKALQKRNPDSLPRPPKVPLFRALWSLLDGTWGLFRVVGGAGSYHSPETILFTICPGGAG